MMSSRATVTIYTDADRVPSCSVDRCKMPRKGMSEFCSNHLYRFKKHGNPLSGRTPPGEPLEYFKNVALNYEGDDCLLWPYARNSAGYAHVSVDGKNKLVHRLACIAEYGYPTDEDQQAAHSCGNGNIGCCNKKHVRWATPKENGEDTVLHGRSQRGEKHYASKLTVDAVVHIRSSGMTNIELAQLYGVERTNIVAVRKMKSWRHV